MTSNESLFDLDEIETTEILIFQQDNIRVVLLSTDHIVKYKSMICIEEIIMIKFVNQYLDILAPHFRGVRIQIDRILDEDDDIDDMISQICIYMTNVASVSLSTLMNGMIDSILA